MSKITFNKVVQAAGEVVFEAIQEHGPEVTYQSIYPEHEGSGANGCWYGSRTYFNEPSLADDARRVQPEGEPACIVARILAHLGVFQFAYEGDSAGNIVRYRIPQSRWSSTIARNRAEEFLNEMQTHQDTGESWAKCLAYGVMRNL